MMSKRILIICRRIASGGYAVIKMKVNQMTNQLALKEYKYAWSGRVINWKL